MTSLQTNIFNPFSVDEGQSLELIDVFDVAWKKIIELYPHSSLIYLIVGLSPDIDIQIITKWSHCSCKIFWLFTSDAIHPVTGSIKVSLQHSQTSAEVELISFLRDGATISIDGALDIWDHLDQVHGRLLEQNIVLWKNISIKTLPKLNIASHNVRASHGANIDTLDQQKLFYMMSRGLTQQQSQTLLVDWYIEYVLGHFMGISDTERKNVYKKIK
jgi:hypothetical protein